MTKSKLSIIIIGTLIAGFLGATGVQADDAKTISAASCVSNSSSFYIDSNGNAKNLSYTTSIRINCSVIRDITKGKVSFTSVWVQDRHPSQNVRCALYSRHPWYMSGRFIGRYGWEYTSGHGSAGKVLNLGGFASRWYQGGAYVQCVIPPRAPNGGDPSAITAFTYGEK